MIIRRAIRRNKTPTARSRFLNPIRARQSREPSAALERLNRAWLEADETEIDPREWPITAYGYHPP